MNKLVFAMHDATHAVPGVPIHTDTHPNPAHRTHLNPRAHDQSSPPNNPRRHHHAPPRVLVGWQNWIARRLGGLQRLDQP